MKNDELVPYGQIDTVTPFAGVLDAESEKSRALLEHKKWMSTIRKERPSPEHPFKIGVYIRYHNQTKHDNYIEQHIQRYESDIALCPKWTLVGFYIDEGASAPNMESAPEWSRLLDDCMAGKVDLIVTQLVSFVSRNPFELNLVSRMLALKDPPVGIYFISEDIFTVATYYRGDMSDEDFFPPNYTPLPDPEETILLGALHE